MRERVIDLHLDHFRIDHDEAQFFWREPEDHARDQRIDADAFAAAGRACDEQVRHLREIGDDCFAVNILAQCQRKPGLRLGFLPILRLKQFAQRHFHFAGVGQFNSDGVFAGNWSKDVDPFGTGRSSQIAP